MVNYKTIKKECLGQSCRSCINKKYHLSMKREDCIYLPYQYKCTICQETKNIVNDIHPIKRVKILMNRVQKDK